MSKSIDDFFFEFGSSRVYVGLGYCRAFHFLLELYFWLGNFIDSKSIGINFEKSYFTFVRPFLCAFFGSVGVVLFPTFYNSSLLQMASKIFRFNLKPPKSFDSSKATFIFVLNALKISGGVLETYKLAVQLRDSGEDVLIVVMWRSPNEIENEKNIPIMRLTDWGTRVVLAAFQLPIIFAHFCFRARQIKANYGRPVWIFTHYSTLPLAMLVQQGSRWSFVQDLEWRFLGTGLSAELLRKYILSVYRRCKLLAANIGLEGALQSYNLKVDAVAPIWADQMFRQIGSEKRDIDVLMVLRKGAHKRLDLYLFVISQLSRDANIRIVVITTEDEIAEEVRSLVSECHVRVNKITIAQIYARTKVFLHLSEHEGFGLPPLEAMGVGCVPVCRDSGGPRSYMLGELRNLLLPLDCPMIDLINVIKGLLMDPAEFQRYSGICRQVFQEGLSVSDQRINRIRSVMLGA